MRKNKISVISMFLIILIAIIMEYFVYLTAGARTYLDPFNIFQLPGIISKELKQPFANYWNQYTLPMMAGALLIYILFWCYHYANQHNLMPGREYGNVQFADPRKVTKRLADLSKDESDEKNIVVVVQLKRKRLGRKGEIYGR